MCILLLLFKLQEANAPRPLVIITGNTVLLQKQKLTLLVLYIYYMIDGHISGICSDILYSILNLLRLN